MYFVCGYKFASAMLSKEIYLPISKENFYLTGGRYLRSELMRVDCRRDAGRPCRLGQPASLVRWLAGLQRRPARHAGPNGPAAPALCKHVRPASPARCQLALQARLVGTVLRKMVSQIFLFITKWSPEFCQKSPVAVCPYEVVLRESFLNTTTSQNNVNCCIF